MSTYYGLVMPQVYTGGVYIRSIRQTKTSTESGGTNEITATLTNRTKEIFYIKNGVSAGFGKTEANVETLEPGNPATVKVETSGDNTAKEFSFTFGIPKGADGEAAGDSYYGVCTDMSHISPKTVEIENFVLSAGRRVSVKFAYMNTAVKPSMDVGGTGSKSMQIGTEALRPMQLRANKIYEFMYDGKYWQLMNPESLAETLTEQSLITATGAADTKGAMGIIKAAFENSIYSPRYSPIYSAIGLGDYLDIDSIDAGELGTITNTNGSLRIRIAGFDTYYRGGTSPYHGILWEFAYCPFRAKMTDWGPNKGGYPASKLKELLNGDFLAGLSDAIGKTPQRVFRMLDQKDDTLVWTAEYCFLPQETEVFGHQVWGGNSGYSAGTGVQWPIYAVAPQKRIKKTSEVNARVDWWTASPVTDDSTKFCAVGKSGEVAKVESNYLTGFSPAFYI